MKFKLALIGMTALLATLPVYGPAAAQGAPAAAPAVPSQGELDFTKPPACAGIKPPLTGKVAEMRGVILTIKAKEGKEAELEKFMVELSATIRANEPGNDTFRFVRTTKAGTYVLVEIYKDVAGIQAHEKSPWVQRSIPIILSMAEYPPIAIDVICPLD